VAVGIFEIEAPDFEEKVRKFIDCHVNKSHDAWVVPPNVENINRVGMAEGANAQVPYPIVPLCPENAHHPPILIHDPSTTRLGPIPEGIPTPAGGSRPQAR
jgi:hypothetical protein